VARLTVSPWRPEGVPLAWSGDSDPLQRAGVSPIRGLSGAEIVPWPDWKP